MEPVHEIDRMLKSEIVLEDDVDGSGAAQDEDESHDADQGGHDHRDDRQIKKAPAGKIVWQKKGDGDADDGGGDHGGHAQDQGIQQGLQVEGVGEEIKKVRDGKGPGLGGEAVVEEPDQRVDKKDDEKGPDGGVGQKAADLHLREDAGLHSPSLSMGEGRGGGAWATVVSISTFRVLSSQVGIPRVIWTGKHIHFLGNRKRLLVPGILHVDLEDGLRVQFDVIPDGVADIRGRS